MSDLDEQKNALLHAIGDCITEWSNVEMHLAGIFRLVARMDAPLAYSLLATPRAFEIRVLMVHRAVQHCLEDSPHVDDWNLLYNYICVMSGKRNQVAHATMLSVDNKAMVLEPYFVMTSPNPHLSLDDVKRRATEFHELAMCLFWFQNHVLWPPPLPLPEAFAIPTPDLLLRLRAEEVARREA